MEVRRSIGAEVIDVLRPAEAVEEWRRWRRRTLRQPDHSLVDVVTRGAIEGNVRAFVSDVGEIHHHRAGQLMLEGKVP